MLFGRAILKHYAGYEVEVWRPEHTLKQREYVWRDDMNMVHRIFRSKRLRYKAEYSPYLLKALQNISGAEDTVIWIHGIYNLQAYWIANRPFSTPTIGQSHGGYPAQALYKISDHRFKKYAYLPLELIERRRLGKYPHLFAISSEEKSLLEGNYQIDKDNISMSPTGIDFNIFYPGDKDKARKLTGLPDEQLAVVYVGRLSSEKGLGFLINSFSIVAAELNSAHLYLVGGGPLKTALERLVAEAGLGAHVHFVGYVDYEAVPDWYRSADVVVMPSLNEWFGKVAAEAMACGTPVVATRAGGVVDIVREFESGQLVPPRDSDALADAVLVSLKEKAVRRPNIERGRSAFSWATKLRHAFDVFQRQGK